MLVIRYQIPPPPPPCPAVLWYGFTMYQEAATQYVIFPTLCHSNNTLILLPVHDRFCASHTASILQCA